MEVVDQKIGSVGEVSLNQTASQLVLEADASSPISISGVPIGSFSSKNQVVLDEAGVLAYFAQKYSSNATVSFILNALKSALGLLG